MVYCQHSIRFGLDGFDPLKKIVAFHFKFSLEWKILRSVLLSY